MLHEQRPKTVNIGGSPKQVVSKQFNSPINLYSDSSLAEAAFVNPSVVQAKYNFQKTFHFYNKNFIW